MRIVGLYNWHDGGYCVLEDGVVVEHVEIERYSRLKEDGGDSLQYFKDIYLKKNDLTLEDVDYWVSPCPNTNLEKGGGKDYDTHDYIPKEKVKFYSHHLCHAAHAFYASGHDDAIVLTIDSAGLEEDGTGISTGIYWCNKKEIKKIGHILNDHFSLGNLWGRLTRMVFKLQAGYPRGHQAGSIMAMAALGDPEKYEQDLMRMANEDFQKVRYTPPGYKKGVYVPPEEDVFHPYLNKYREIAASDDQEKYNIAASLQKVTETYVCHFIEQAIAGMSQMNLSTKNICFAGGVSLNSVALGKITSKYKDHFENFFVPPVPYDGGLSIGACQYLWHSELGNDVEKDLFVSPYLGEVYSKEDVLEAIEERKEEVATRDEVSMEEAVDLLVDGNIVAIFQGRSESGRRALGNRSILANPGYKDMKSIINDKVKHRQWYRPFAPSVLESAGEEWFENFFPSPYMGFVFKIKKEKLGVAKAIEHFDGTARIQTVREDQNSLYFKLITKFHEKTGIPMVLNTSFNDREPICETPGHSINCYLGTNIDYLYFPEFEILVSKK
jgi:carbamoyltransferase